MKGLIFFAPFAVALLSGCGSSNLGTLSAGITPGTTVPPVHSLPVPPAISHRPGTQCCPGSTRRGPASEWEGSHCWGCWDRLPAVAATRQRRTLRPCNPQLHTHRQYDRFSSFAFGGLAGQRQSLDRGRRPGPQHGNLRSIDGTFTSAGNLFLAGTGAPGSFDYRLSLLLQDGRVLVEGVNAEIYDPTPGTFSPTAAYADANPYWLTSTLLQDGRVLLTGCVSSCTAGAVELYDPITNAFSFAGLPTQWGDISTATRLVSGKVLFVGNWQNDGLPRQR